MSDRLSVPVRVLPNGEGLPLPSHATDRSAGTDLRAAIPENNVIVLRTGERALVPTGVQIALPDGCEAQVRPRSGLAIRHGVTVLNSPGTIDADYRGEIGVVLINHGRDPFEIRRGDRIAQLVIARYATVEWQEDKLLDSTERGEGGFGHTGR